MPDLYELPDNEIASRLRHIAAQRPFLTRPVAYGLRSLSPRREDVGSLVFGGTSPPARTSQGRREASGWGAGEQAMLCELQLQQQLQLRRRGLLGARAEADALLDHLLAGQVAAEEAEQAEASFVPPPTPPCAPAPLDPRALRALRADEMRLTTDLDDKCSVCLEPRLRGQTVLRLGCGHSFHVACARRWLACSACCPMCRKTLRGGAGAARRQPEPPPSYR